MFRKLPNVTFLRGAHSDLADYLCTWVACGVHLLTLCEATARSTKLGKTHSYNSAFYQKKEALLLTTTLPCLKAFVSLITKNKPKSSWHTEKFAKNRLKDKSSGRMRT